MPVNSRPLAAVLAHGQPDGKCRAVLPPAVTSGSTDNRRPPVARYLSIAPWCGSVLRPHEQLNIGTDHPLAKPNRRSAALLKD
jgi:hypothetical protein